MDRSCDWFRQMSVVEDPATAWWALETEGCQPTLASRVIAAERRL